MDLEKLYKLQEKLDKHILEKHNCKMTDEELFNNTKLALLVEVGELANTTRCFKHWSTKGQMAKEIILDELADVWHFYLSLGNQLDFKTTYSPEEDGEFDINVNNYTTTDTLNLLYFHTSSMMWQIENSRELYYDYIGVGLSVLQAQLNFTSEEVEQAYLKKHKENYKRQEEGY